MRTDSWRDQASVCSICRAASSISRSVSASPEEPPIVSPSVQPPSVPAVRSASTAVPACPAKVIARCSCSSSTGSVIRPWKPVSASVARQPSGRTSKSTLRLPVRVPSPDWAPASASRAEAISSSHAGARRAATAARSSAVAASVWSGSRNRASAWATPIPYASPRRRRTGAASRTAAPTNPASVSSATAPSGPVARSRDSAVSSWTCASSAVISSAATSSPQPGAGRAAGRAPRAAGRCTAADCNSSSSLARISSSGSDESATATAPVASGAGMSPVLGRGSPPGLPVSGDPLRGSGRLAAFSRLSGGACSRARWPSA